MNKGILLFIGFTIGGTAGVLASNQYFAEKYRQIADDEIESVKAAFLKERAPIKKKEAAPKEKPKKEGIAKYTNYKAALGYDATTKALPEGEAPVVTEKEPYVIPPELYGEKDEYEGISLTYYKDGTLTDDAEKRMTAEDIRKTIGAESLTHFGEYEDDAVHVRNDVLKCDYEVLMDRRTYAEMKKTKPYLQED